MIDLIIVIFITDENRYGQLSSHYTMNIIINFDCINKYSTMNTE